DYANLERTCGSPKGDPRSDIFFLGCIFYQMLTGQLPMPEVESKDPLAKMLRRGLNMIKPLSEQRHAPPEDLTRVITKMMRVDLKSRYQSMDEVVGDLEAYEESMKAPVEEKASPKKSKGDAEFGTIEDIFNRPTLDVPEVQPKIVLCVEFQED